MDAHTNVESLSFSFDGTAKKIVVMTVADPFTRRAPVPIPVPNISLLRPPLGARPPLPLRVEFPSDAMQLTRPKPSTTPWRSAWARPTPSPAAARSTCCATGQPLRSRMLVGVRGAGMAYDGLYYVNSVTHNIKRGQYKQSFSLSRDGLVSNVPAVPT